MFGLFFLFLVGVSTWLYLWALKRKNYWKDHNVPHVESPLLMGNFAKAMFLKESIITIMNRIYHDPLAKDQPFIGINVFHRPALILRDTELIKRIMVKDFNDFASRFTKGDVEGDPIGAQNLFQVENPTWKAMRQKLTPVFTSGKMKQWFQFVNLVGNNLNLKLQKNSAIDQEFEVKELAGYYTLDGISLVALAADTNSLFAEVPSDVFLAISKTWSSSLWRKLQINSVFFLSDLTRLFKVTTFSASFDNLVREIFNAAWDERVKSGQSRGDLIDALIAVKKAEENDKDSSKTCH